MNLIDLYAFFPEEMHGSIAVAADAISITQDGAPFVLFRSTPDDVAELSFTPAKSAPVVTRPADPPTPVPVPPAAPVVVEQPPPPVPAPVMVPIPEPKLSFFQRLTNFFTRS